MDKILKCQEKVLKVLADKMEGFYLGGGTALSRVYFGHRKSYDLDFFTKNYSTRQVSEIIEYLSEELNTKIILNAEQTKRQLVRMSVYDMCLSKAEHMKIDFIEDIFKLIMPTKKVDGIAVLSLEDIYIRKLLAIIGTAQTEDIIGRKAHKGGREEAKDFFDLYTLSNTFMRLSEFAQRHCDFTKKEAIIRWFRTYDRMNMKTGLLDIAVPKRVDYKDMERHFKRETDELIKKEIGLE